MAHLDALMAANAPTAVLLKRGPRQQTRTIGWDRRTDSFAGGQCLRKLIDHRMADLSPDGAYLIYFVNDQSWSRKNHVYRAVSRAPWLKALTFWGSEGRDLGPGFGMFFRDEDRVTRIRAPVVSPPQWDRLGLAVIPYATDTPRWRSVLHPDSSFFTRLQRDGWTATTAWEPCPADEAAGEASWRRSQPHRIRFEKRLGAGWTLRQTSWCGAHRDANRGLAWQSFALVSPTGAVERRPAWEWGDSDPERGRVVWTADCVLYAAAVTATGLGPARILLDTRRMVFERIVAPY